MIYTEIETGNSNIKAFEIKSENLEDFQIALKENISKICFGEETIYGVEDQYPYKKTFRELAIRIDEYSGKKTKYGIIAELIMHTAASKILGTSFLNISVLLSGQGSGIKKGFDLNFIDDNRKEIWFGEVKSSVSKKVTRAALLDKAKNGLESFFNGLLPAAEESTEDRWYAASQEAMLQFARSKNVDIKRKLLESRSHIANGKKQNVVLMIMSFKDNIFQTDSFKDIENRVKDYLKEEKFKKCIVIAARKETFEDIINFIREEGK